MIIVIMETIIKSSKTIIIVIVYNVTVMGQNMEWTFRPLDYFFGLFFGPFFG